MPSGLVGRATRRIGFPLVLLVCAGAAACGGRVFGPEYEYEEEIYLSLDGSATVNINASVAALVALRGADLDVNPRAQIDRDRVRALFEGSGADVAVSLSRREGRRFVHVSLDTDDVRQVSALAPFGWSAYRFERQDDVFRFRQVVGKSARAPVEDVGWTGEELVLFKMHLPSEIVFHNAPSREVERGNILEWPQPLTERLDGVPLDMQVHIETTSILSTTLLLFGSTIVAVAVTFALVVWLIARRGRAADLEESRS